MVVEWVNVSLDKLFGVDLEKTRESTVVLCGRPEQDSARTERTPKRPVWEILDGGVQ